MKKTLLILRHAKSSWSDESLTDHDRPLKARGKRDAPRMGRLLREEGLIPDHIITSTARRARDTANLVAEVAGYHGEIEETRDFYHAPPRAYVEHLQTLPAAVERVLVVGHNPGMEELVELLTGVGRRFPTAALAHVALPVADWEQFTHATRGELLNLWRPKELRR